MTDGYLFLPDLVAAVGILACLVSFIKRRRRYRREEQALRAAIEDYQNEQTTNSRAEVDNGQ